jgi:hypothetical protein
MKVYIFDEATCKENILILSARENLTHKKIQKFGFATEF